MAITTWNLDEYWVGYPDKKVDDFNEPDIISALRRGSKARDIMVKRGLKVITKNCLKLAHSKHSHECRPNKISTYNNYFAPLMPNFTLPIFPNWIKIGESSAD